MWLNGASKDRIKLTVTVTVTPGRISIQAVVGFDPCLGTVADHHPVKVVKFSLRMLRLLD